MEPGPPLTSVPNSLDALYPLAERRAGHLTTSQAAESGVSRQLLSYLAGAGTLERVTQGVYRLRRFPAQRFEDVVVACLWAGEDAVASHDTALSVHGLTDLMPTVIHITVPRPFRGRRAGVVVHRAELAAGDRTERDGVPVTTVVRTIADVHERSGPDLARAAAVEALDLGRVTRAELDAALAARGVAPPVLLDPGRGPA